MLPRFLRRIHFNLRPAHHPAGRPHAIPMPEPSADHVSVPASAAHLDYDHRPLAADALEHYALPATDERFHVH